MQVVALTAGAAVSIDGGKSCGLFIYTNYLGGGYGRHNLWGQKRGVKVRIYNRYNAYNVIALSRLCKQISILEYIVRID